MAITRPLEPAIYIDTDAALVTLVDELSTQALIAVDTESNNMYAYQGQVCLIQLSTRTTDYIIDPLAIDDMKPLGMLLFDERIEKIFHAAEYDLICLRRDFGFEVRNLFDTMYAARLVHIESFGLADLLDQFLDVQVDKSHQLDDWGKRPLPRDSLLYAQMDTHYLPILRDMLLNRLLELDRIPEAHEIFADVLRIDIKDRGFDPEGFWKIGLPRGLSRKEMAVLRELYLLRDAIAQELDEPSYKVLHNKVLVALARQQPRNFTELHAIKQLPPQRIRVYGQQILKTIQEGRTRQLPPPPENDMPSPEVAERYTALHTWRKERAEERNLDSSLVLSKQTLWELAREMPETKHDLIGISGFGRWRLAFYGDEIIRLIDSLRDL